MKTQFTLTQFIGEHYSITAFHTQLLCAVALFTIIFTLSVLSHFMDQEPQQGPRLSPILCEVFRGFNVFSRPDVNLNAHIAPAQVAISESTFRGVPTHRRAGFVRDLNDRTGTAFAWLLNSSAMVADPLCHRAVDGYIGFCLTVTEPYIGRPRVHVELSTRLLITYGISRVKVDGRPPIWNHQGGISSTIVYIDVGG